MGIMLLDRHEDLGVTLITPEKPDIVTCKPCVRDMKTNRYKEIWLAHLLKQQFSGSAKFACLEK